MKIDRKQLVKRLSAETGLGESETEKKLDQWIAEVVQGIRDGEEVDLGSFGIFQPGNDGAEFTPSETLQAEMNREYEGLEPIELIGAYQRQAAVSGKERYGGHVVEADQPDAATPPEKKQPGPEELSEGDKIPEGETVTEPAEAGETAAGAYDWIGREGNDRTETDGGGEEEHVRRTSSPKKQAPKKRRSDPIGTFLTAAVAVLLVLGGGWLTWEYGFQGDGGENAPAVTGADRSDAGISPGEPGMEASGEPADAGGEEETEPVEENLPWGLTGPATEAGGYTIVVHSLNEEGVARELEETFLDQGYRVLVRPTTVNGTRYWRVGLGQFETVPDAQQAVTDLPEPYRSDHFIRRIQ